MALPRKVFAVIGITFPVTAYRRLACVLISVINFLCNLKISNPHNNNEIIE